MIEGYSVDEAASVLGVPKGRVWELLARGILAGTPEDGGGMRVYLQGRPMEPIVGRPPEGRTGSDERHAPNGNGGEHGQPGFEASPFRELLTEFRNLTERYGQALLALGESRGEVASLRTRVELLEARVDLRLPPAPPMVQWSPPAQAPAVPEAQIEPEPMPSAQEEASDFPLSSTNAEPETAEEAALAEPTPEEAAVEAPPAKTTRARRRRQAARSATQGFAEALARAQDPTTSELPGGAETQAAFNELRERIRRESREDEGSAASLPTDEPSETMGFTDVTAPAPEVELDSFLADEELGGGVAQATVAEAMEATVAEAPSQSEQTEDAQPAEDVEQNEMLEAVQATELDDSVPIDAIEPSLAVEPADAITEDKQIDRIDAAERTQTIEPVEAIEPSTTDEPIEPAPQLRHEPELATETTSGPHVYSREWDEPDWIAEEDVDWGAGEPAALPSPQPVAMGESPEIGWDELPSASSDESIEAAEAPAADAPEGDPELLESAMPAVDTRDDERAGPYIPAPSTPEPVQFDAIGPTRDPASESTPADQAGVPPETEPPASVQAAEEELMWLGDEFHAGPSSWRTAGRATTIPKPAPSPAVPESRVSPAEEEALSRLAVERGWDDDELSAIRSLLAQPGRPALDQSDPGTQTSQPEPVHDAATELQPELFEPVESSVEAESRDEEAFDWEQGPAAWSPPPMSRPSRELPGAVELDQAMAAFEVGAWSKETAQQQPETAPEPTAEPEDRPQSGTIPAEVEAPEPPSIGAPQHAPTPPASVRPSDPSAAEDHDWLRGRRGPAANAYRRLRRLFP